MIADITYNIIFGLDAKAFDQKSEFVDYAINQFNEQWHTIYAVFPFLRKIFPNRFTSKEFTNWFIDLYENAVKLRKENNIIRDDYLAFLIDLKNRKNTPDHVLHAHAYTFFLDGFETTSYLLGCAINLLAEHKVYQDKLRTEVKSCNQNNFDELHNMPYLDAVVNGNFKKFFTYLGVWL